VAVVGEYIGATQKAKGQPLATAAKWLITLWMLAVVAAMFLWVPPHAGLGTTGRIIIMHVPTAWVTMVAFAVSGLYSGLYLWRRRPQYDDRALAATELGFLFSILATVTGSIFAKIAWGSFWNWEPRETTILVLLLIYGAYFALRSAIDDRERRQQLAAVYALFAFVTAPLLIFVIPRQFENTLHPNCAFLEGSQCDGVPLGKGQVNALGDQRVQLLDIQRNGDVVTAVVDVSTTGGRERAQLQPTLNTATGERTTPNFIDSRFMLSLESVAGDQARLNIVPPANSGQVNNTATRTTLIASVLGFTGLFFWVYAVRSRLLGLRRRIEVWGNA
jgi:heme exporter protein C